MPFATREVARRLNACSRPAAGRRRRGDRVAGIAGRGWDQRPGAARLRAEPASAHERAGTRDAALVCCRSTPGRRRRRRCDAAAARPARLRTGAARAAHRRRSAGRVPAPCSFRVQDVLPPTYLHVLAFPVSVALMTEPSFPFALPAGARWQCDRATSSGHARRTGDRAGARRRSAGSPGRPAGRSAHRRDGGDELVWRSRSTYLRPGKPTGPKSRASSTDPPPGPAALIRVPGDTGRRYAAVSGDRNPIHLYPLTARAFGFRRAMVHGMWLKAECSPPWRPACPTHCPSMSPSRRRCCCRRPVSFVAAQDDGTWRLDVRSAKSGRPHLIGTVPRSAKPQLVSSSARCEVGQVRAGSLAAVRAEGHSRRSGPAGSAGVCAAEEPWVIDDPR